MVPKSQCMKEASCGLDMIVPDACGILDNQQTLVRYLESPLSLHCLAAYIFSAKPSVRSSTCDEYLKRLSLKRVR